MFNFNRFRKRSSRSFKNELFRLTNCMILICLVYFILFFVYLSFKFDEIVTSYNKKSFNEAKFKKSNLFPIDDFEEINRINLRTDCYFESDQCFDFMRCVYYTKRSTSLNRIKVYVYSQLPKGDKEDDRHFSKEFAEFIQTILDSDYYEHDPSKACLFVPLIDLTNEYLIDRHKISKQLHNLK